jgi:catechol 2,3-dioxygenase-like lactoylglutathione lyase family enzyme
MTTVAEPLYTGLRVRNVARSVRFYRALGLRPILRKKTGLGELARLRSPRNGWTLELTAARTGRRLETPGHAGSELDHLAFFVADVDRSVRALKTAGGRVRFAPFDAELAYAHRGMRSGRAAFVVDPDGIWIELVGPTRAGAPRHRGSSARRARPKR